ncbi:hypothetical protein LX32DRAFT_252262 [Colletotrichum zoysiae]|uniref:Uncharacterized protein n=1 Tax=Colletotrichum zoysiae TaxID=1216348 RepID=A0AAD9H4P9_9PEZI|nr:hypothetical protein LX32DRAFT_252262 [Colletotrichum zoysiae]
MLLRRDSTPRTQSHYSGYPARPWQCFGHAVSELYPATLDRCSLMDMPHFILHFRSSGQLHARLVASQIHRPGPYTTIRDARGIRRVQCAACVCTIIHRPSTGRVGHYANPTHRWFSPPTRIMPPPPAHDPTSFMELNRGSDGRQQSFQYQRQRQR